MEYEHADQDVEGGECDRDEEKVGEDPRPVVLERPVVADGRQDDE